MIDYSVLFYFVLATTTLLLLPGSVHLVIVNSATRHGMQGAFWSIVGTNLASLVLISIAGLMISGVAQMHSSWLEVVTSLGGVYLIYYAYNLYQQQNLAQNSTDDKAPQRTQAFSKRNLIKEGFLIGISNPEDIVFFISFFPPFISKIGFGIALSLFVLTLIWCILDYSLLLLYGLWAQKIITPEIEKWVIYSCAVVFSMLGIYAIYSGLEKILN